MLGFSTYNIITKALLLCAKFNNFLGAELQFLSPSAMLPVARITGTDIQNIWKALG